MANINIYVGNLPWDTTQDDLYQLFGQYGQVAKTQVITDRDTGRSRGFGFVTMGDATTANAAIAALNGKEVSGRALTVNEARAREERPRSFAGGDRRDRR